MKAKKRVEVVVWVCRECGNYFAASSAGDLTTKMTKNKNLRTQSPRSRCPTPACQAQARDRESVRIFV